MLPERSGNFIEESLDSKMGRPTFITVCLEKTSIRLTGLDNNACISLLTFYFVGTRVVRIIRHLKSTTGQHTKPVMHECSYYIMIRLYSQVSLDAICHTCMKLILSIVGRIIQCHVVQVQPRPQAPCRASLWRLAYTSALSIITRATEYPPYHSPVLCL